MIIIHLHSSSTQMLNQSGINYSVADKGKLPNLNRPLKEMLDGSKC